MLVYLSLRFPLFRLNPDVTRKFEFNLKIEYSDRLPKFI